jgi:hypothetical protein
MGAKKRCLVCPPLCRPFAIRRPRQVAADFADLQRRWPHRTNPRLPGIGAHPIERLPISCVRRCAWRTLFWLRVLAETEHSTRSRRDQNSARLHPCRINDRVGPAEHAHHRRPMRLGSLLLERRGLARHWRKLQESGTGSALVASTGEDDAASSILMTNAPATPRSTGGTW